MYTKKNIVVLRNISEKEKESIQSFVNAREKEQFFEIIFDDFIEEIEEAVSFAELCEQEVEVGETVLTQYIASATSKIYPHLKKRNLLYKSLGYISSKMKKFDALEKTDVVTQEVNHVIRKKKAKQGKPNSFFGKCLFPRQLSKS